MITDSLILAFVALSGYLGHRSGTLQQAVQWVGMACGRAGAKPLALVLTLALFPRLGFPPAALRVGLFALCFYTIYILAAAVARFLMKRIAGHRKHAPLDRAGGLALGAAKGATLAFVLLSAALFFEKPLDRAFGTSASVFGSSLFVAFAREHNAFGKAPVPALLRLQKVVEAARDPRGTQALAGDPALAGLLEDPGIKASLNDEALARALKSGNWPALKKDPRVIALLKDPRIAGPLRDPLEEEPGD